MGNSVSLYDIVSSKNGDNYVIVGINDYNNKRYLLLSRLLESLDLDCENLKVVEYLNKNNRSLMKEIKDEKLLLELSKKFIVNLRNA